MEDNIAREIQCSCLAERLANPTCDYIFLLLDCRPFMSFNDSCIVESSNVHCPPILKRRSGGFVALENIIPCTEKRDLLLSGHYSQVIFYDEDTTDMTQASKDSNLFSVLKSFKQQVDHCEACYLKGITQLHSPRPFTPTDGFSSIQSNEWKSPLQLLSVERVNLRFVEYNVIPHRCFYQTWDGSLINSFISNIWKWFVFYYNYSTQIVLLLLKSLNPLNQGQCMG